MMVLITFLFVVFVVLLVVSFPSWPHSSNWGYGPCGGLAIIGLLLVFDWLK